MAKITRRSAQDEEQRQMTLFPDEPDKRQRASGEWGHRPRKIEPVRAQDDGQPFDDEIPF